MNKKQILIWDRKYDKKKKKWLICWTDRKWKLIWLVSPSKIY